jgi:hypothetical protein
MSLELLPNEILLDLFEYFNGIDLLRGFYGLNFRFNFLLYKQIQFYSLDFESISKRCFDRCQQHLFFIADRVSNLSLSDSRENPGQINLFLSYIPSFNQFTQLRSLTISDLHSDEVLLKLLNKCHHLNSLTHLSLKSCTFPNREADSQLVVDKIWSLPKLISCSFDMTSKSREISFIPTVICPSLKNLSFHRPELRWSQMERLLDYTPCLNHLRISFTNTDYVVLPLPTLTKLDLNIFYKFYQSTISILFQSMYNLRHLSSTLLFGLIYGYQWEQIIRSYLLELKTFRLQMQRSCDTQENVQKQANKLIDSFRSSFWIDERQWFVRCLTKGSTIYLYTLPETDEYYTKIFPDSWQSTYPHDNQQEIYNSITEINNMTLFDQMIPSDVRLPNIKYLDIKLPINDQFWSIVPNLNKLQSLTVYSHNNIFHTQLQDLLNRASHLHTLSISQDPTLPLQISLFKYKNPSVYRIDLHNFNICFSGEECIMLTRSPLGIQCEVLFICISNRENIINLVKNMVNLRTLIVTYVDEYYDNILPSMKNNNDTRNFKINEVIQWLKDHLPSTYVIMKEPQTSSNIIIWT